MPPKKPRPSTFTTFERMGQCYFACNRRIGVVVNHVMPHCRSSYVTPSQGTLYVCRSYAVHTPRYTDGKNNMSFNHSLYAMGKKGTL